MCASCLTEFNNINSNDYLDGGVKLIIEIEYENEYQLNRVHILNKRHSHFVNSQHSASKHYC